MLKIERSSHNDEKDLDSLKKIVYLRSLGISVELSLLDGVRNRAMMGEYDLYYQDKVVGEIYDDRFLVKPIKTAVEYMTNATYELPYDGAKEMLLVDDKEYLAGLFKAMYSELPMPKAKKEELYERII